MKSRSLFPIKYNNLWQRYKDMEALVWTAQEINMTEDKIQWTTKLNDDERYFIKHVLAFFSESDSIVNENLLLNVMQEKRIPQEGMYFYACQMFMENVHSETYSLMIDALIQDITEKNKVFNAIENIPCVQKKAAWAAKWISKKNIPFAQKLVAFAAVEGIFFSGSFCSMFWLKKRGLMPGLSFSNSLISRDEHLHVIFACLILMMFYKNDISKETITNIITEAVDIECDFVTNILPVRLVGINADLMIEYIKYTADRMLFRFDIEPYYNSQNPFDWMEMMSLDGKSNMFEKQIGEYTKAKTNNKFEMDDDF